MNNPVSALDIAGEIEEFIKDTLNVTPTAEVINMIFTEEEIFGGLSLYSEGLRNRAKTILLEAYVK